MLKALILRHFGHVTVTLVSQHTTGWVWVSCHLISASLVGRKKLKRRRCFSVHFEIEAQTKKTNKQKQKQQKKTPKFFGWRQWVPIRTFCFDQTQPTTFLVLFYTLLVEVRAWNETQLNDLLHTNKAAVSASRPRGTIHSRVEGGVGSVHDDSAFYRAAEKWVTAAWVSDPWHSDLWAE